MGGGDNPAPVDQGAAALNVPHRSQPDPEVDHPGPVELLGVAHPLELGLLSAPTVAHGNRRAARRWVGCCRLSFMPYVGTVLFNMGALIHFLGAIVFMGSVCVVCQGN